MNNDLIIGKTPEEMLQALVLDRDLERLEDLLAEFNLFEVLKIERKELQHSALLAWLLDPRGSHGLRDYFLRKFLFEAAVEGLERGILNITPLDVDGWALSDIEVATERDNKDIILINKADGFVCLIENKIGASEHSGQLGRYLGDVEVEYEGLESLAIFLTPDGMDPENEEDAERYIPLDYEKIDGIIGEILQGRRSTISSSAADFLEQYSRTLRRHVLATADNIDDWALRIYNNHRAAIDLVINAKKRAMEATDWDVIDAAIEKCAPGLMADFNVKWYHRYYSPELDEISMLKGGRGWTDSGRILLFECRYRTGTFGLVMGPGPADTRERIYELFQSGGINVDDISRGRKLGKKWHTLYNKRLLTKRGSSQLDYEQGRAEIEKAVSDFFENDYWPLINAIRAEFGFLSVSS